MRKLLVITLWVLAIGLWMPIVIPQNTNPYQELYDEVLMPVVKIRTPQGVGSGVVIHRRPACRRGRDAENSEGKKQAYILTAAHVVGNESLVQVYIYEYNYEVPVVSIETASVVITDTNRDLALLRVLCASAVTAKLAPRDYTPYLFTEVYAVGCSLGLDPRPSDGILSALCVSAVNRWEISAPILSGNSGGGVFLKSTHELIGIAVWIRTYHGQLVTTMAGIVPINQIYEFLDKTPGVNSEEDKRQGLTCWSDRDSECAIGIRGPGGPTLLTKGGEKIMAQAIVSRVQLFVPLPSTPPARIVNKWADKLKDEALAIFQKLQTRIPDDTKFKEILGGVSGEAYAPVINPDFVSRAGTSRNRIVANQTSNLLRSYDKWIKKLTRIFETVDTVEAARFKELVDLMKSNFAEGIANRTLPFTGTRVEGRSAASIAPLWLVNDVTVAGLIRPVDKVEVGGPKRITSKATVPSLKAALQGRLVQAGNNIVKANFLLAAFNEENDRTNEVVNGFRDPALNIEVFTTGGFSHVDYILLPPIDQLFLEVQIAVTP